MDPQTETLIHQSLAKVAGEVHELAGMLARDFVNGEIGSFVFDGATGVDTVLDDQGATALSYAVYNDTDVPITILTSAIALAVPKRFLLVAPLTINGHVQLQAEPEALGEETINVLRWRFPTPQPFFACKLE
jgi:hypothetical protein